MAEDRIRELEARIKTLEDRLGGSRPAGVTDEDLETYRKVNDALGRPCWPRPGTCIETCWSVGTCLWVCWPGTCFGTCESGTCHRGASEPGGTERFGALGAKKK